MEGVLQLPPERGTIIGRASWKSRYVIVGGAQRGAQMSLSFSSQNSASSPVQQTFRPAGSQGPPEAWYLSIYKNKEELGDPIQRYAVGLITTVQVQMVAHRKQGTVLPTLIVVVAPDPAVEKVRKRRSSRTAGLTSSSSKDSSPTTLWFRAGPDESYSLHDWARFLQQLIQPNLPDRVPMSPITPASPTFVNPFALRPREGSEVYPRPSSGNPSSRATLQQNNTTTTQTGKERDRPVTFSESVSLRSKRSDISSQTSSMHPLHTGAIGFQTFSSQHPASLPSPAATIGDYQGGFIEGWTSAQGRSSTLSSPSRTRDSYESQIPGPVQPYMESGSPPGPRETILDRAFQMRYIPGAERSIPGEEKLSSLARFEALMRKADDKRKLREQEEARSRPAGPSSDEGLRSAWDLDEDDDEDEEREDSEREQGGGRHEAGGGADDVDDDDSDEMYVAEEDQQGHFIMPSPARRALNFIAARHVPEQTSSRTRSQSAYNQESPLAALQNSGSSTLRPQTGYSNRNRPGMAQRTHSQPQLAISPSLSAKLAAAHANALAEPFPPPLPSPPYRWAIGSGSAVTTNDISDTISGEGPSLASLLHGSPPPTDRGPPSSSLKRLSFTEFTKRLSSTSSMLLGQSNNSAAGSDIDVSSLHSPPQQLHQLPQSPLLPSFPKPPVHARGALPQQQPLPQQPPHSPSERDRGSWDRRCPWRGNVGVLSTGGEGGFL